MSSPNMGQSSAILELASKEYKTGTVKTGINLKNSTMSKLHDFSKTKYNLPPPFF